MSSLLLQIVAAPLAASPAMLLVRPWKSRVPAWVAIAVVACTPLLLVFAGWRVSNGEVIFETYYIGPNFSVGLSADGRSLPVGLIVSLICLALVFYSIHYVEHHIELIYGKIDATTYGINYRRFFLLYLYFVNHILGNAILFSTINRSIDQGIVKFSIP